MVTKRYSSVLMVAAVVAIGLAVAKCEPTLLDGTGNAENRYVPQSLIGSGLTGCAEANSFLCLESPTGGCCPIGQDCCGATCCAVGFECRNTALGGIDCFVKPDPTPTPTAAPGVPVPTPTPGTPTPSPSVAPTVPTVPAGCEGSPVIRVTGGSLQAAINAAPNGAFLIVGPGVYNESLTIAQPITIVGEFARVPVVNGTINVSHADVCIVDLSVTGLIFLNPPATGCTIHNNDVGGCIPNLGTNNTRTANVCHANAGTGCTSNPVPCNN